MSAGGVLLLALAGKHKSAGRRRNTFPSPTTSSRCARRVTLLLAGRQPSVGCVITHRRRRCVITHPTEPVLKRCHGAPLFPTRVCRSRRAKPGFGLVV